MMSNLGAAVIGLGVGRRHVEAYANLPESTLVAVCDQNPERLWAVADEYHVSAYTDVADLLRDERVEVVSIATPHPSHASLAIAAMEAGRHVIVEKPMTLSLDEADAMIACARERRRTLAVIFQRRFWPAALRVRQAIQDGKLGAIVSGECELSWWRTAEYYGRDPWRGRWDTEGGGVLVNQGIHAIDMFHWYMGEPEMLWARWANLSHPYIEVEDNAVAAVQFRGGALGVIRLTTSSRLSRTRIAIHGANGSSVGVLEEPEGAVGYNDLWTIPGEEHIRTESLREHVEKGEYIYRGLVADGPPTWHTGYAFQRDADPSYHAMQIQDFLRAILEQREPLVNGEEGRKSLALMTAIYQSGRTGAPVRFPIRS
jgi:UDP-N-acetyl-2-amino-2-deoxyglucuronate dehydrogenase